MARKPVGSDPLNDGRGAALVAGRLADPFGFLGPHNESGVCVVRSFQPGALKVEVLSRDDRSLLGQLAPLGTDGLFAGAVVAPLPYLLRIHWPEAIEETEDPYSFGLLLGELDLHLFAEGCHWQLAERLGAAPIRVDGVAGVRFAVWAPNARRVSVVGDFNAWDGRRHPMRLRHQGGVWELFVPRLTAGARYKYELIGADGTRLPQRADPLARATERPPATASVVPPPFSRRWSDQDWMAGRARRQAAEAPITIYEVHAPSWLRPEQDPSGILDWRTLAERLVPYVRELGFTHVELLPIMEHPFGGSWGYQPLSLFAPSARFGDPGEFAHFVEAAHRSGLGVILDWVPGHFPADPHGLARFDGTALYEHADPREGFHRDWNTLIYNFGRREVQGFLIASALYWLNTFHVDGLRVDAVASMLYRDYSRKAGEWIANRFGGRENLEAIALLQRLNRTIAEEAPGAITIAEESTAWPGVSARLEDGGLGFSFKWNMGWMHDSLRYMGKEPIHRRWHHNDLTFSMLYAYSERFVLPLSHDEVVHGKGSLYGRMPGDVWQKRANLRAYFAWMWTHPGKKLLFMGGELGQPQEWNHDGEILWQLLDDPGAAGLQRLIGDLNRLYVRLPQLHASDFDPSGFSWVVADDDRNSVFAFVRRFRDRPPLLVVANLTPQVHQNYRLGVPGPGFWRELLNTDGLPYGGSGVGNWGGVNAQKVASHGYPQSLTLTLPPLASVIFQLEIDHDAAMA